MFKMGVREFKSKRHVFKRVGSPVGTLTLVANDDGLRGLLFQNTTLCPEEAWTLLHEEPGHEIILRVEAQLSEYFAGVRRTFDIPLVIGGTAFQERVWTRLLDIPYGRTVSYSEIAEGLGDIKKARPVGGAVGLNPIAIIIPCHRVVGKNGALTGFGGGLDVKSFLLSLEAAR